MGVIAIVTTAAMRSSTVDRKSTRLNSSHLGISYAVFCLKKNKWRRSSNRLLRLCWHERASLLRLSVRGSSLRSPCGGEQTVLVWCLALVSFFFLRRGPPHEIPPPPPTPPLSP